MNADEAAARRRRERKNANTEAERNGVATRRHKKPQKVLTTDGTDFTDLNMSKLRERRCEREPNAVGEENSGEGLTANFRVMGKETKN